MLNAGPTRAQIFTPHHTVRTFRAWHCTPAPASVPACSLVAKMMSLRVGQAAPFRASSRAPVARLQTRPVVAPSFSGVLSGMRLGEREDGQ